MSDDRPRTLFACPWCMAPVYYRLGRLVIHGLPACKGSLQSFVMVERKIWEHWRDSTASDPSKVDLANMD